MKNTISKLLKKNITNFNNYDLTTFTFGELLVLQTSGQLDLNHPTQRNTVWTIENATKMIQSIIQGFPFEPLYIVKNKEKYSVIDGKQRLSAMFLFMGLTFEQLNIRTGKTKNSDKLITSNFNLEENSLDDELSEELRRLKTDDEPLNYHFFTKKFADFINLYTTVTFPVYFFNDEDKEIGYESNVQELFRRLNSTGVNIESGEIFQAKFLEIVTTNEDDKNRQARLRKIISDFSTIISGKEPNFYRHKEWFLFGKVIWIYKNLNKIINGEFDDKVIDNLVDKLIDSLDLNLLDEIIEKFESINGKMMKIKNNLIFQKINDKNHCYSIFNKTGGDAGPNNSYLDAIYPQILTNDVILSEEVLEEKIKLIYVYITRILKKDKSFAFFWVEEEGERIEKYIMSKFTREPQKIKFFCYLSKLILEGKSDDDSIRNSIFKEFFKDEGNKWSIS